MLSSAPLASRCLASNARWWKRLCWQRSTQRKTTSSAFGTWRRILGCLLGEGIGSSALAAAPWNTQGLFCHDAAAKTSKLRYLKGLLKDT